MSGTIYTRTYTYTGQNNTAVARSVALSKFRVSGDTTHQIGQILSITYRHTHTRMGVGHTTLLGRLVFSDGSYLDSSADEHYIENSVVTFVNTWSNLPTAANWSALTSVRTVYTNGNYQRDNELYWRANSAHPMTITITFYEEPPTRYAPRIDSFIVGRCNELAQGDDEGEYIMTTAKLSLGDSSGLSAARIYMYYIADTPPTPEEPIHPNAQRVELTSRKNDLLAGVTMNTTILTGTWDSAHAWFFTLVFEVGDETASAADSVGSAFAPIAVSLEDGGARVGFGGFPRRPIGEHSAEFFNRAYFYGGFGAPTDVLSMLGIQHGSVAAINVTAMSVYTSDTIAFDPAYKEGKAPTVIVSFSSNSDAGLFGRCAVSVCEVSSSGFKFKIFNGDSTDRKPAVNWVAIGEPS